MAWHTTLRALRRLGIRIRHARLAVTFVYFRPNYKRSLELMKVNGHCVSPTCAKPFVVCLCLLLFGFCPFSVLSTIVVSHYFESVVCIFYKLKSQWCFFYIKLIFAFGIQKNFRQSVIRIRSFN